MDEPRRCGSSIFSISGQKTGFLPKKMAKTGEKRNIGPEHH